MSLRKLADIISTLQPHQQRALERGLKNNLILAHSTGSGKTLTAIALADKIGKPTTVLTPASLVENFKKELAKHKKGGPRVDVMSLPTAISRNIQVPIGNTLIVDEAHSLRNAGTARQEYIKRQLERADRVFALTGTPNYNDLQDIAELANIVAKKDVLGANLKDKYERTRVIMPSWWDRWIHGVKPGEVKELARTFELRNKLSPYVDVFDADVEKPKRIDESYHVPMSEGQQELYDLIESRMPSSLIWKLRSNLPPSKEEARSFNSFLTGVRQVANSTETFDTQGKAGTKLQLAADKLGKLLQKNPNARALVYSNFLQGGIDSYAKLLDEKGIPYNKFTGSLTQRQKKNVVDSYNSGEVPVILASGAGSEGLDLKKTRLVQILEPHWNESKIDQVIGRGIRYKSHEGLPPEERSVTVQRFYSTPYDREGITVDDYLATRAKEKQDLFNELKKVIKTDGPEKTK